jgi:hypothetical protein
MALLAIGPLLALLLIQPAAPAADEEKPPMPFNLACNTDANEDDPHVSSDGRTLWYSSTATGKWRIHASTRSNPNQPWGKGVQLDDYLMSKDSSEKSLFVTPEMRYPQYMFTATKKTKEVERPNFDIYVSVRQNARAAFTAPTPVNTIATVQDEMHPWLTADGRRLYFSRKEKEGWRVWTTSREAATGAAGFKAPAPIKELPLGFHHATLSPDGRTMYLQGPVENDRWGLFVSTYNGTQWTEPVALSINSAEGTNGDTSPCLSRDGRLLYFSSDRPGGKGGKDLWVIPTDQFKKPAKKS